jgi:hypothetical protein
MMITKDDHNEDSVFYCAPIVLSFLFGVLCKNEQSQLQKKQ